jgi:hypothetical protein
MTAAQHFIAEPAAREDLLELANSILGRRETALDLVSHLGFSSVRDFEFVEHRWELVIGAQPLDARASPGALDLGGWRRQGTAAINGHVSEARGVRPARA